MKLQRENFHGSGVYGEWCAAADVDALIDSIRAAVDEERSDVEDVLDDWSVPDQQDTRGRWWGACADLDALLGNDPGEPGGSGEG